MDSMVLQRPSVIASWTILPCRPVFNIIIIYATGRKLDVKKSKKDYLPDLFLFLYSIGEIPINLENIREK